MLTRAPRHTAVSHDPGVARALCALGLLILGAAPHGVYAREEPLRPISTSEVLALEAPEPPRRVAYGDHPDQFGHLWIPEGEGPHPLVVFFHGGCWLEPYDIKHVGFLEQGFAEAGYAVWSVEYRRVDDDSDGSVAYSWPQTFRDAAAGVDFVRTLAAEEPISLDPVVVAGHSAGAQIALFVAARSNLEAGDELYDEDPIAVGGVLALAPAANLSQLAASGICGGVVERLMGGGAAQVPQRYQQVSPLLNLATEVPQTVILGALDAMWRPAGESYVEHATGRVDRLVVIEAPESGHFEMILPSSSTWPLVLEGLSALFDGASR